MPIESRDASQDNPDPESRNLGKFFNPEIPGLRCRDPWIVKIVYFHEILKFCVFLSKKFQSSALELIFVVILFLSLLKSSYLSVKKGGSALIR